MGDFSNGNDAVILKDKGDLAAIKGQKINLVEFSVSHYLLARALESKHLAEKDIKVVNTSDADMAAAYKTPEVTAVVTWNPIVSEILGFARRQEGVRFVADSRRDHGSDGRQYRGAEGQSRISARRWSASGTRPSQKCKPAGAEGKAAKEAMAKASGTDLAGFDSQLASTKLFDKPADAEAFTKSAAVGDDDGSGAQVPVR